MTIVHLIKISATLVSNDTKMSVILDQTDHCSCSNGNIDVGDEMCWQQVRSLTSRDSQQHQVMKWRKLGVGLK